MFRYISDTTLFCYVLGTPVNSAISVRIGRNMKVEKLNISDLKKLIWPNNSRDNELKLWKYITPLKKDNNELKEFNIYFHNNTDLTQKLGDDLSPAKKFISIFPDWKNIPDE